LGRILLSVTLLFKIVPISYPKELSPDLAHQSRLHSLIAAPRVHRSHSLRTPDRGDLISNPLSCTNGTFIHAQSQSPNQRISNRSIRHQMSATEFNIVCRFWAKSRFWSKIKTLIKKIEFLVKNQDFGQKSWSWSKIKILVKNHYFGERSRFWSQITMLIKNRGFGDQNFG